MGTVSNSSRVGFPPVAVILALTTLLSHCIRIGIAVAIRMNS